MCLVPFGRALSPGSLIGGSGPARARLGPGSGPAQVQLGDVRCAEGAQVQAALVLVHLADVRRHRAARVVEAPPADAAIVELHHQAVAGEELHQHLLAEELGGRGSYFER